MKINILGKDYDFQLRGTIGLVYMAERMLGCDYDSKNKYHQAALYYCCLSASNRGREIPDFLDFISSLTIESTNAMAEYFWREWQRLEGTPEDSEKKEENAQGED